MKTRYVAITTHGQKAWVVCVGDEGESLEDVTARAEQSICGDQWDQPKSIEVDTELKNLRIVSYSVAQRKYKNVLNSFYDAAAIN